MTPTNWTFNYTGAPQSGITAVNNDANLGPKAKIFLQEFLEVAVLDSATEALVTASQVITNVCTIKVDVTFNAQDKAGDWEFPFGPGAPEDGKNLLSAKLAIENYARFALQNFFDQAVMSKATSCKMTATQSVGNGKTLIQVDFVYEG
jgi:hypothetical protein